MSYKSPPQIFHTKENSPINFVLFPTDLFAAINNLCSGNEAKILFTFLGCKGDGSFSPSTKYMLEMTGIPKPNHYFVTRKKLEDKKYIELDEDGNIYVNLDQILNEYKAKLHGLTPNPK